MHSLPPASSTRSPPLATGFKGRFRDSSAFIDPAQSYRLLPFDFERLREDRYVLTNMAGEFIVVHRTTLEQFIDGKLLPTESGYSELKAKHFLEAPASLLASQLLALKVRTGAELIKNFTSLHMFGVALRCDHSCQHC